MLGAKCELSERALRNKIYFPPEISLIGEVYYYDFPHFKLRQRYLHNLKAPVHATYTGVSQPWQP